MGQGRSVKNKGPEYLEPFCVQIVLMLNHEKLLNFIIRVFKAGGERIFNFIEWVHFKLYC